MTKRLNDNLGVRRLMVGSLYLLLINASAAFLNFGVNALLARSLGIEEYSVFSFCFTVLTILTLFAAFGTDIGSQRFVAAHTAKKEWPLVRGFVINSSLLVAFVSTFAALALVFYAFWSQPTLKGSMFRSLLATATVIPGGALLLLTVSILRALRMPVLAALPRQIFKPLLLGFFVILAGVGLADNPNSTQTVFFELTATLLALTFSVYLMVRNLPSEISWVTKSHSTEWLPTIIPLFLLAVAQVLVRSIDILFVGHFLETTAIGIYSAASRTAQLAAFGLMAVNGVLPALVSRYYALGQMQDVQKLVSVATWVCFLFSAVATGFIWGFGMQALGLFGPEFTEGYTALCILAAGQLVNALSGSVSFVLAMTGRTMLILYTYLIATLASVLLSIVIIPRFGIEGAALVTASITGAANLALAYICIRKVQVNPTIFAFKTRPVTK